MRDSYRVNERYKRTKVHYARNRAIFLVELHQRDTNRVRAGH